MIKCIDFREDSQVPQTLALNSTLASTSNRRKIDNVDNSTLFSHCRKTRTIQQEKLTIKRRKSNVIVDNKNQKIIDR